MVGRLLGLTVAATLLAACGGGGGAPDAADGGGGTAAAPTELTTIAPQAAADMTIAEILEADGRFSRFGSLAAETTTGLSGNPTWLEVWDREPGRLGETSEGVTVFVPTDQAFAQLEPAVREALQQQELDNDARYLLIGSHYVHRIYPSDAFEPGQQRTWIGAPELRPDPLTFGGAGITQTDLRASNGYIHVLDGVIVHELVREEAEAAS